MIRPYTTAQVLKVLKTAYLLIAKRNEKHTFKHFEDKSRSFLFISEQRVYPAINYYYLYDRFEKKFITLLFVKIL